MAIERERKFIYTGVGEFGLTFSSKEIQTIQQGYLMLDDNSQLRVRVISSTQYFPSSVVGSTTAYVTYKQTISKTDKYEFEYEIPWPEGRKLMELAKYKLTKTRFKNEFEGCHVDIDFYKSGLKVVEIEYEDELTSLPDYCGEEITGINEYSNIAIAIAETAEFHNEDKPTIESDKVKMEVSTNGKFTSLTVTAVPNDDKNE